MGSEESNEKIVAEEEMHADKLAKFVEDAEKLFEGTSKSALAAAKSAEAAAAANPNAKPDVPDKGKPLNDYLEDYGYYTGKASDISRSLALAGIAIIWIFKDTSGHLPFQTLLPLSLLILSLAFDLIQYILGSIFWGAFYEINYHKWKKKKISDAKVKDLTAPNYLSIPLLLIFFAKIIIMIVAYSKLYYFIIDKIK